MLLYLRELSDNKKTFFIWTGTLIVINIIIFSFYPSIADEAASFKELLQSYPEVMLKIFGAHQLDLSNILHSFGVYSYLFISLLGSIYALSLGSEIIAKEQNDKTIEFLLAKPISRRSIITSKTMAVFTYILVFNLILFIFDYALLEIFKRDQYSIKLFVILSLGGLMLHLTYAAIGIFISSVITKVRTVMPISLGIVFGMFAISKASSISDRLSGLKYITPFSYVDATDIITNGRIDYIFIIIMIAIIAFFMSAAYVYYSRKDIYYS